MMIELERVGIKGEESVASIANLSPIYISKDDTIEDAIKKMISTTHRSLPVVSGKKLVGIITVTDVFDLFLRGEKFSTKIENVMIRDVVFAEAEETVSFVLKKMKISKKGRLPVVSGKNVIGVVGERDYVYKMVLEPLKEIKNKNVMTAKPFFIKLENTVDECLRIMVNTKYRRLPVVENKKLVGYITSTSLLRKLWEEKFSPIFLSKSVSEIMTKKPYVLKPNDTLDKTVSLMKEKGISSLLITGDDYRLEGIITERDVIDILE